VLSRRPKITQRDGGVFYFRARVPTRLIGAYGKRMESVSLRTRDPVVARQRARERRVEFDKALAALEQRLSPAAGDDFRGRVLHLSDDDIEAVCDRFRAKRLADDVGGR
jgi:hypothetical protein